MSKKKVCLIIPSLRHGGSERVMSELANMWAKDINIRVTLILLTNNQKQCYEINEKVKIVIPSKTYDKSFVSKLFYKIWILFFIRKTIINNKPDSVLSFGERYNNIVLLALVFSKIRVFVSDRNSPYLNIGFINNKLRNMLYKNAAGIIAQTSTALNVLSKNTNNNNIQIIENPLRKIKSEPAIRKKVILNVGRNVDQKNQLELIEIFEKSNVKKDWVLKILGNGPLRGELEQKVKDLNIEQNVQILDFTPNIDEYFREASIFAFTSIREGFPNALLEAKAHGLACISYDCPTGPKEILEDDVNGYLIPLGENKMYIKKLSILMNLEDKIESLTSDSEAILKKYSMDNIGSRYLNFITAHQN